MNAHTRRQAAAAALTAGPVLYLAAESITGSSWSAPRYSYTRNWISDLGVPQPGTFQGRTIDSPLHDVMNAGFLLSGIALLVGLLLLAPDLPSRIRHSTKVLAAITTIGYWLVGLTHTSTTAAANGTLAQHFVGAFLAILGGNTLAITLGIHWWRARATIGLGHGSVALGILGLAAVVALGLTTTSTTAPNGLIDRIAVYTVTLWQLRVALQLATTKSPARRPLTP